jgi:hypothetical protein
MNDQQRSFHTTEFDQLRSEILDGIARGETLFFYAVVSAAGLAAWLITEGAGQLCGESIQMLRRVAWWLPTFTTLCVGLLGLARYMRVKELGRYLRKIEARLGDPDLGWERQLSRPRQVSWALLTYVACWTALLASTVLFGAAMTSEQPDCGSPPNTSFERTRER